MTDHNQDGGTMSTQDKYTKELNNHEILNKKYTYMENENQNGNSSVPEKYEVRRKNSLINKV